VGSSANGTKLISVCGKGGTGKTVFTAMMTRALLDSGRAGRLLVIDADPALGQLSALGARVRRTMGQIREDIIRTARRGNRDEKAEIADKVDYMVFDALSEMDGFALLAMGRTESLGCFCPVNSLLRSAIETLSKSFDTILVDGEAGIEQINRRAISGLSTLIMVSDPTQKGVRTACHLKTIAEKYGVMGGYRSGLVFNRTQGDLGDLEMMAADHGLEVWGKIPLDENVALFDRAGRPTINLPDDTLSVLAVKKILSRLGFLSPE
jgi:CO dehydrogenase maturation factor